jgi:fatty-acyl-CoA synthase
MTGDPAQHVADLTLSELLRRQARERPEAEALVYPTFANGGIELRLTFRQLDQRVDALARGLISLGIEKGEHVALWAANVPDWIPLEFALARIGAVLVTVNTALSREELAYLLGQSRSVAVIHTTRSGSNEASRSLDALIERGDPGVAGLRHRIWLPALPDDDPPVGLAPDGGAAALLSIEALVVRGRQVPDETLAARESACRPEELVNIQYTSGTTGFPKGVMLSHRNILGSGYVLGLQLGLTPEDRVALIVPLFHCFGCVVAVLGSYVHGAALCALPTFEAAPALKLLEVERCTIVHGVPTMFSAMLADESLPERSIRTLRAGLAAGAPCPVPLMKQVVERLRCAGLAVTYGLTEASPGVAGSLPDAPLEVRCETIGRPLPGVDVKIVDPANLQELPDGEPGELWVAGSNVMLGYHDDPQGTAEVVTSDGWLRTGDLCLRDEDGNLRVVGRLKDLIIRGGENIAPAEIENVLREHEGIQEVAVVGVPDEQFGERVAAAVVLRKGARLDPESYAALLEGRVAAFKVPELWKAFKKLPLTGSGKVQKYKLRERFKPADPTPA